MYIGASAAIAVAVSFRSDVNASSPSQRLATAFKLQVRAFPSSVYHLVGVDYSIFASSAELF